MNWLYYLAEANAYLAVIYGIYYLALRGETFYQLNRVYLLTGIVLAFIIPFLQLGILRPAHQPLQLQIVPVANSAPYPTVVITDIAPAHAQPNYLLWLYCLVAGAMLLLFCNKVLQLVRLAQKGKRYTNNKGFSLIELDNSNTPAFSFFNYLFISRPLRQSDTIIRHELVHIRQKHSWDVVFLELFKIINWFNPVVYLLQNSLKELHEYLADEHLGQTRQEINDYTDFLIDNAYGAYATSLTNNFFHKNLLKKRIVMLHKKRSGYLARLKYLLIIPLCLGLMTSSTLAFAKTYGVLDLMPQKDTLKVKLKQPPKVAEVRISQKPTTPPAPPKVVEVRLTKEKLPPPPPPVLAKANDAKKGAKALKLKSPPMVIEIQPSTVSKDTVYSVAEQNASFPGGLEAFYQFLTKNIKYPEEAKNAKQQGKVFLTFIVEKDGSLSNLKVIKGVSAALDAEAVRVMKTSPRWNPGRQKNKPVRQQYTVPINFSIAAK